MTLTSPDQVDPKTWISMDAYETLKAEYDQLRDAYGASCEDRARLRGLIDWHKSMYEECLRQRDEFANRPDALSILANAVVHVDATLEADDPMPHQVTYRSSQDGFDRTNIPQVAADLSGAITLMLQTMMSMILDHHKHDGLAETSFSVRISL